jgi:threonine/homoserine/homoserine lactone efflux protein
MTESLITMSITGLIVGFVFSIPIAGPISILVTSNAFKGRLRYCNMATIGASVADFVYVFIAVFGLTKLYSLYKPAIPYILLVGMLFLFYTGYKIIHTKVDLEHIEDKNLIGKIKIKDKGGFYTGCITNLLNPTLFIGWLSSSFFVISFVAALGLNAGGLDIVINQNVNQINNIESRKIENPQSFSSKQLDKIRSRNTEVQTKEPIRFSKYFHLLISICYAFFLSVGGAAELFLLTILITRFRQHINLKIINGIVFSLGIVLCLIGLFFGFVAARMLFISWQ